MKLTPREKQLLDMLLTDRINDKHFISKMLKGYTLRKGYRYDSLVAEMYKVNVDMLQLAINLRNKICK